MNRIPVLPSALVLVAGVFLSPPDVGGAEPATPAALAIRVDRYLAPYLETGNFAGTVLIAQGNETLHVKGYGRASLELGVPNTPDTVFHIASVSKGFTAAAILRLEELGQLSVGDSLARHLPDYPNGDRITIHHLLIHSSGIPNVNAFDEYDEWQMVPQTVERMVERFRDSPLQFEPGSRYGYSNSNYNLLALLIEKVSGQSYGEFLSEQIFRPAGMTATGHHADRSLVIPGRATGYAPVGMAELALAPQIDWSIKTGNGSLYTTVGDLYRWHRALGDDRVLSSASRAKMFREYFENVGYGFFTRVREAGREIYSNGRSPGFGAFLGRWIDRDLCVVVLMNLYSTVPTTVGRDLAAIALGEEVQAPRFSSTPPPPELLQEIVGTYQFGPDFYVPNLAHTFFVRDRHLWSNWGWHMAEGGLRFRDRTYWTEVEFLRDEQGRIAAVMVDEHRGERVESETDGAAEPSD